MNQVIYLLVKNLLLNRHEHQIQLQITIINIALLPTYL